VVEVESREATKRPSCKIKRRTKQIADLDRQMKELEAQKSSLFIGKRKRGKSFSTGGHQGSDTRPNWMKNALGPSKLLLGQGLKSKRIFPQILPLM
jgi:hypothetical protein